MKRFTVELPDEYDDVVTITSIGQTMGVANVRTNVLVRSADLNGHDGETLVIHPNESPEWRKPETGWIPVTERLPETGTSVFVREGNFTGIGFFGRHTQKWIEPISGAHLDNVTHWMPLPEPPEGV